MRVMDSVDTEVTRDAGRVGDVMSPRDRSMGTVNGQKFYTPVDMFGLVMFAVRKGTPQIVIAIYEPEVIDALGTLGVRTAEELEKRLLSQLRPHVFDRRFAEIGRALTGWQWALIIEAAGTAIAGVLVERVPVILAFGDALFLTLLGIAIIIAVRNGHDVKNVTPSATSDVRPSVEISLSAGRGRARR